MPTPIEFQNITNARDLGGMPVQGGTVRPGLLIRSGNLGVASAQDLEKLEQLGITLVFDFRSDEEAAELPDPVFGNAVLLHRSPMAGVLPGIAHDEKSDSQLVENTFKQFMKEPSRATDFMMNIYERRVLEEEACETYRWFLRTLAQRDPDSGAVLWHCTAGKDRAGLATAWLLLALGASREDIIDDYLTTNRYIEPQIQRIMKRVPLIARRKAEVPIRLIFEARREFIEGAFAAAERQSGSLDAYMEERLGADASLRRTLREKYVTRGQGTCHLLK